MTCPKLSAADKEYIMSHRDNPRVNAISADAVAIADEYGYSMDDSNLNLTELQEVSPHQKSPQQQTLLPEIAHECTYRTTSQKTTAQCNFIQPVPSQILTVFTASKQVIHIELDSNATINYIKLDAAKHFNFAIKPNSQLSILADGITKLPAMGEINETFFRNDWSVTLQAVVVKNLHTDFIGGTVFLRHNNIKQDFARNTIQVQGKFTVPTTSPAMVLTIQPQNHLCKISTGGTILPGQNINIKVPFTDKNVVAVEAGPDQAIDWPQPQLCQVQQGTITIINTSTNPIIRGKDAKVLQIRPTTLSDPAVQISAPAAAKLATPPLSTHNSSTENITFNTQGVPDSVVQQIHHLHAQHQQVFDKNLTLGYNGAFGPHICRLNWASDTRPTADGVRMVSYSHDLKQLHQEVCDDLTQQGVLGIPQNFNVNIQFVCPSFLRRKPKAKGKANHLLTKDDVRLVVNFSPINDHLKNIPSIKTTPNDILVALGRWKVIIVFDLHQGFFQNHMQPDDSKWLGIDTPFGGIRFMRRSGQGLLGQSEELEELLTKILKQELQSGQCCKIADDIFVGGSTHAEAADTYATILKKLHTANLKISAKKTTIFPKTADILGWTWKEGGRLLPSPHRQLALKNTRQEDITTVKDMRSWVGLYKTLLIATPQLAQVMDPFDQETASKESREKILWTDQLSAAFRSAKAHIDNVKELYLPAPDDQLLLVPDGAQKTPGIGHVLYAIVNGQKRPVRFHSVKLPEHCKKWSPCEVEALAFATGIQSEMDIIKESTKPLLIAPDSTPVKDAVNLIKKGKFSASSRMNSFITNINRVQVEVVHASGKANLNAVGDMQSRNPPSCSTEYCTICNFVTASINSVLSPNALLGAVTVTSLYNPKAWAAAQKSNHACKTALDHLRTGKQPSKKSGAIFTEVRRYCSTAKINNDGCLIVPQLPSFNISGARDRIIIPTPLLPSVLWHLHNSDNHPTKSQLRQLFDKLFYGIMVQNQLDQLYQDCYRCKTTAALPKTCSNHTACTEVNHPGQYFHADIIRRERQKIFILRDNFSSLTAAMLIPSEQAEDLKEAIINLTSPIRMASSITVRVDAAMGFQALTTHQDLKQLGIDLQIGDSHNKNSNAVVDKACAELETEINKLQPAAGLITLATLAQAVLFVNQLIRRKDKLTATEIHFARDRITGENIIINDQQIRQSQLHTRQLPATDETVPSINTGDTVVTINKPQKHHIKDLYLVTSTNNKNITMQKIATNNTNNIVLQPKVHTTSPKLLQPVHQPTTNQSPAAAHTFTPITIPPVPPPTWNPFHASYFHQEEESEDEDDLPRPHIQQLNNWLEHQRQNARRALAQDDNAILAYLPPPPPPPPPPPRAAKVAAIQAIQQLGARHKTIRIPQVEGAEPTPETTPEASLLASPHQLSPQEPWSPIPFYQEYEDNLLEQDMDIFASWPSTSTLWDGEERASLTWDDAEEPLMLPTLQPLQQLQPQQLRAPLNLPLIFKEARLQAHCNRRDTFAGFPVLPFPKRIKISKPDYSVWHHTW